MAFMRSPCMAGLVETLQPSCAARLDRDGPRRSRLARQMTFPGDSGTGLAPAAAHQSTGHVSTSGLVSRGTLDPTGTHRGPVLGEPRHGLPRQGGSTGVHVAGPLGCRSSRSVAGADRSVATGRGGLLVWVAGMDRARIQTSETGWLAMAIHPYGRSRAHNGGGSRSPWPPGGCCPSAAKPKRPCRSPPCRPFPEPLGGRTTVGVWLGSSAKAGI